jgi:TonB family protein
MTRPALRAVGALLFLSALPALAAQPKAVAPGVVIVPSAPAPAAKPKPAPKPPSPAAAALGAAFKEVTASRVAGSYAQWLDTLPGFRFSPVTSTLLTRQFGTARLFSVKRQAAAGGARDYVFTAPALRHANLDGSSFSWDAMSGNARVEADGITIVNRFSAPRLAMEDKTMRMEVRGVTASSTGLDTALSFGTGVVQADQLQTTMKADGTALTMDGLSGKFAVTDEGTSVGMSYETGVRSVTVQDERIDDLHMALQFKGLDKAAMESFSALGKQMRARQAGQTVKRTDLQQAAPMLRQLGLAVTAKDAAIVLDDISFSYRGSKARMHGELHFDNVAAADLDGLPALLKKVTGHADVEVPLAMFRGLAESIARKQLAKQQPAADAETIAKVNQAVYDGILRNAVASGYLRVEGDMLVTSIDIRDGVLTMNGKPVQMPRPAAPVAAVDSGAGSMRARRIAEKCTLPDYPADVIGGDRALSLAMQLTVGDDGKVTNLAMARSSGLPAYDAAVLAAASQCTYIPALHNGKPVAVSEVWEIIRVPGTAHP